MKRNNGKALLIILLTLMLLFVCVFSPTFSWFQRPAPDDPLKGDKLELSVDSPAYDAKNITIKTYELISTFNAETGQFTETEQLANLPTKGTAQSFDLASNGIHRYRTEITNTGSSAQDVSLYIRHLAFIKAATIAETTGKMYIGTNGIMSTHKYYGLDSVTQIEKGSVASTESGKMHFYIGLVRDYNHQYGSTDQYRIHYWNNSGKSGDVTCGNVKIGQSNYTVSSYSDYNEDYDMFFVELDDDITNLYLYPSNNPSYKYDAGENSNILGEGGKNTVIWFYYGSGYHSSYQTSGTAARIQSGYNKSMNVPIGDTLNIGATGTNLVYESSDTSVATVAADGTVTGVANGTATITITSKGPYWSAENSADSITRTCEVTVFDGDEGHEYDVPIVTNVHVNAAGEGTGTTKSVDWYIKNEDTGSLQYKIYDGIYLGL